MPSRRGSQAVSGRHADGVRVSAAPADYALAALAKADTLPKLANLVAYGEVMALAVTRAKLGRDSQNDWGEFKLDAERKAGLMLAEMPKHRGGNEKIIQPLSGEKELGDLPRLAGRRGGSAR